MNKRIRELNLSSRALILMLRFVLRIRRVVQARLDRYLFLWVPNWVAISREHFLFGENLKCSQKLLVRGQGIVLIGNDCHFGYEKGSFHEFGSIEIQTRSKSAKVTFGDRISTNNNLFVCAMNEIRIGSDCLIGPFVAIADFEAHSIDPDLRKTIGKIGIVHIGNNVWIGSNVKVLKNTRIGDNSIVAANAVVSGEFPANVIIGGVPAKIIKHLDSGNQHSIRQDQGLR